MPYTGLFLLRSVAGDRDVTGRFTRATAVTFTRLTCERRLEAKSAPDLEAVPDGAILYCRGCGTRQVATNAHFDEFLARTRGESAASAIDSDTSILGPKRAPTSAATATFVYDVGGRGRLVGDKPPLGQLP